jgi:hypothetical protein
MHDVFEKGIFRDLPVEAWHIGHFENGGAWHSDTFQVKWGYHPKDSAPSQWGTDQTALTMCILISGSFEIYFENSATTLHQECKERGDYVLFGPGIFKRAVVIKDSVVLTIRWLVKEQPVKTSEILGAHVLELGRFGVLPGNSAWIISRYRSENAPWCSTEFEVKWGEHMTGSIARRWTACKKALTVTGRDL